MDREEAATLRRQALPAGEQEMRASLAVFLAQVEGSATVTADHVAAAADIADGNALAAAPDFMAEGSAEAPDRPGSPAAATLPPAGATRRWRPAILAACVLAACVLAGGLAGSLLRPGMFGRVAGPGRETGVPAPVEVPPKAEPAPRPPDTGFAMQAPAAAPTPSPRTPPVPARRTALLAAVPAHVTVSYQRGSGSAQQRAVQLVRALRAQGLDAADPEPAADVPRPRIGYFFAEDGGSARTVARTLAGIDPAWGEASMSQMPASSRAMPPPGSIALAVPADKPDPGRHA